MRLTSRPAPAIGGGMSFELSGNEKPGDRVWWVTVSGERLEGTLEEWDSNVAVIRLDDGTEKCVET